MNNNGVVEMKKIILMIIIGIQLLAFDYNQYSSDLGLGFGMGLPSGYELKLIYRQSPWLSFSLNYNQLRVKDFKLNLNEDDFNVKAKGDIDFTNPGIMAHFHPLGNNLRISVGYLYSIGNDFSMDFDGKFTVDDEEIEASGNFSIKLGEAYPYIGVAYGYSYNSAIKLDFSAGVYLVKAPKVSIRSRVSDSSLKTLLDDLGLGDMDAVGTDAYRVKQELDKLGGDFLDLFIAYNEVMGTELDMINKNEIENDISEAITDVYDILPKIGPYNILPVISIGFTVFLF